MTCVCVWGGEGTDWVRSRWRRGRLHGWRRAVRRLVFLLADVQRGEEVGQQPQDVDDR